MNVNAFKFRKKPVIIEAFQWHGEHCRENAGIFPEWMVEAAKSEVVKYLPLAEAVEITTLEGTMRAELGDWIIRGVKGELYPCKPDIFEATYEPADAALLEGTATLSVSDGGKIIDLNAADFSDALMWLKEGKRVQRAGWNGADQYVVLIPGEYLARSAAGYGFGEAIGEFTFGNVLALKNAQNIMQPGWIPSMGDLMAEDWQVVA